MSQKPPSLAGLHHVALNSANYEATRSFYIDLLGFDVEWEPDSDNVYLTTGSDNLAIHRSESTTEGSNQRLDHIGMLVHKMTDVDLWYQSLVEHDVKIIAEPKTHRDGARSFYCEDPEGTTVQVIFHPPISKNFA